MEKIFFSANKEKRNSLFLKQKKHSKQNIINYTQITDKTIERK
jgi:hypothetical protein